MSLLVKRTSCLPAIVTVCLLGATLDQPARARGEMEIPPEVGKALEKNATALGRITVAWERKRSSTFPLPDLLQRIQLTEDLTFLEPYHVRYSGQDGMFRVFVTYRYRAPERGLEEYDSDIAVDKKTFYSGTGVGLRKRHFPAGILSVTPLDRLIKKRPDVLMWDQEYFHAAGFEMPAVPSTVLQPPRSRVLDLVKQGAHVTKVWEQRADQEVPHTVIDLAMPDRVYRFDLDPSLGYAMRREEERSESGALAVVTTNSDFVRLPDPEVWLPRRCRAEWHTWHTIPDHFSPAGLLMVDFTVSELSQTAVPVERFSMLDYYTSPNVLIADGRLPGADQEPNGRVTYLTPASPEQLDEAIRGALESQKLDRGKPPSRMLWWVAFGLTLGAALTGIGIRGWHRATRRAAEA